MFSLIIRAQVVLKRLHNLESSPMSENDRQPVKFVGVLLLAAILLAFLVLVWLIGAAFAGSGVPSGNLVERMIYTSVLVG
ncbi:hypothetical protein CU100_06045 [Phyllobacterium endophyticum]|uniref:Uncharacterized protein n=2 Tax=Phyllobacterium endophyticum TaxID=1149773 RepID=A0A2P7B1E7_9HYPH|nr:hypothetical protein CU100_06045 [Phyllobacterium endophyticum]